MLIWIAAAAVGWSLGQDADGDIFPRERALSAPLGDTSVINSWIETHPEARREERRAAWSSLCDAHSRAGRYRQARDACRTAGGLFDTAPASQLRATAFWSALAEVSPIEVNGVADMPLTTGWPGLGEVTVRAAGVTVGWAVDTGAEVTTLAESDAVRFGVRFLPGDLGIGGSTSGTATGRLGVLDEIVIGDAVIRNIPVFVLPDAALTVPGKGRLPPILGMPVLYGFGRIAFTDGGTRLLLGGIDPVTEGAPIRWSDAGLALDLGFGDGTLRLHLDSGANQSELLADAATALIPSELQGSAVEKIATSVGVSGAEQTTVRQVPLLTFAVGEHGCVTPEVLLGDDGGGVQGRIGMDFVRACRTLRLDFTTMTASAGPEAP